MEVGGWAGEGRGLRPQSEKVPNRTGARGALSASLPLRVSLRGPKGRAEEVGLASRDLGVFEEDLGPGSELCPKTWNPRAWGKYCSD